VAPPPFEVPRGALENPLLMKMTIPVRSLTIGVALLGLACSDQEATSRKAAPEASITGPSSSSRVSAFDEVTVPVAACPVGDGVANAHCGAAQLRFTTQVDAAVASVIARRPELFDLTRTATDGGPLVLNGDAFYAAVVAQLESAGICASHDFSRGLLQVKQDDTASEDYELLHANGHARMTAINVSTCSPAAFPLTPAEVISYVRVGFYGIECLDGQEAPRNGERLLPIDCLGLVTATPKKADGTDVHSSIHGPDIVWELDQPDDYVDMLEDPAQPFNKILRGLDPGTFTLCATVQGIKGCLTAEVPRPQ
jgi:hypothetical protein